MILNAIAAKLKRRAKDEFKGRHFEAALIVQAVLLVPALPAELSRHRGDASRARARGGPHTSPLRARPSC